MRISLIFSLPALILLSLSCSDDQKNESDPCNYDIVCLKEQTAEGGSIFSMYLPDDNCEIVYRDSRAVIDTSIVAVGNRLMLAYESQNAPYESGPIRARGYTPIYNSPLMVSVTGIENSIPNWRRDGIYLYSIWRSGDYINIRARLTFTDEAREFVLVIDEEDIHTKNPFPVLHLVHRMTEPLENFQRQIYASFDIGALWHSEWINGVIVKLSNTNLETDSFTFTKNN